jgi:hypothetical protein
MARSSVGRATSFFSLPFNAVLTKLLQTVVAAKRLCRARIVARIATER